MKLNIILEPAPEGGWVVYPPALPGCVSEGVAYTFHLVEDDADLRLVPRKANV